MARPKYLKKKKKKNLFKKEKLKKKKNAEPKGGCSLEPGSKKRSLRGA